MQTEYPVVFECQGDELLGIVHDSDSPSEVGAIIVVAGGPQYRVGVNRQFVMMGRMFAEAGVPTLRFDHRGIGDSAGEYRGFIDMQADIRAAVDALQKAHPSIKRVALWGECESATAISFYGYTDPRVSGLFMVNPWIRTDEGQAKTLIKHYYLSRLSDKKFWKKVASGKFNPFASLASFVGIAKQSVQSGGVDASAEKQEVQEYADLALPERLEKTTSLYKGSIYIVTSGKDFIAQEFKDHAGGSKVWKSVFDRDTVKFVDMEDADHTFSRIEWRNELFELTLEWLKAN